MVELKRLPDSAAPAVDSATPAAPLPPLAIALEEGGEAVFRTPTVKDARLVERSAKGKLALTDICRELSKACLVSWAGEQSAPEDDDIYASDDQEIVRLFLRQLAGVEDAALEDAELVALFLGQAEEMPTYEVLPDRSHRVTTSLGSITFRRLTRKDLRRIEGADTSKTTLITGDVLTAVSTCTEWWRSERSIMPADLDPLPLSEFKLISQALQGFLRRSGS